MIKWTTELFIEKAKELNDKIDYSKTIYTKKQAKSIFICPEHGEFEQSPEAFLNGHFCPKCGRAERGKKRRTSIEEFIEKANEIHNNKYDYSKTVYEKANKKVLIFCKDCGKYFEQTPNKHLAGQGCPFCKNKRISQAKSSNISEFIEKANEIHNNKYDYSKFVYINAKTKGIIICPKHGEFEQSPDIHLQGFGCHKCLNFTGENIISSYFIKNNISYKEQYRFDDCKDILPLPFDFYIKDFNCCVEFNGRQHYDFPNFFHKSYHDFLTLKHHDWLKRKFCRNNKINLLTINFNDDIIDVLNKFFNPFPYPEFSNDKLIENFEELKEKDGQHNGNKIIWHFHKSLWSANRKGKKSPLSAWNDVIIMDKLKENRKQYANKISPSVLRDGLTISGLAPRVSFFHPSKAKELISKYLNEFDTVFDPFSGFSGRLLGCCSLGKKYIGQDINKEHVKESNEVIKFLNLNATVLERDIFESSGEYDCLFTCPPYNLKEVWNDNETDLSCDEWIDVCLSRFKCKKYLFVVDKTEKYNDNIIEEINNKSHLYSNNEKVILIEK